MDKIDYSTSLTAEIRVDVYAGEKCDEHRKYWNAYAEGDMQDEDLSENELTIDLRLYP